MTDSPHSDADTQAWAATLATSPGAAGHATDPQPCTDAELLARMDLLAVPDEDRDAVLRTWPGRDPDGDRWRTLRACHHALFDATVPAAELTWPDAPAALGERGRYFYVHRYLAALPRLLERHRRLGIYPRDLPLLASGRAPGSPGSAPPTLATTRSSNSSSTPRPERPTSPGCPGTPHSSEPSSRTWRGADTSNSVAAGCP